MAAHTGRFAPLLDAPAMTALALIAVGMLWVYVVARRKGVRWGPMAMRVLAVLGFLIPCWTVVDWWRSLSQARDWAQDLGLHSEAIAQRVMANSAAVLALGFVVLVSGIFLARRLPQSPPHGPRDAPSDQKPA